MSTPEQNQQIIVEHIVNIDTTAESITSINSVADIVVQLVAVAGMLPDVAATVAMRSTLLAVAKKLAAVQNVADAMPLLEAVCDMDGEIRATLAARTEIASVVAHLDAVRSLAAQLDILVQSPQHAADAKAAAATAANVAGQIGTQLDAAKTARLGAELAEDEAKVAAASADTASDKAAASSAEARLAADAAAAVSGLPNAGTAAVGDPVVWDGTHFVMGQLAENLASTGGKLGVAEAVLQSIRTAQQTADALDAKATQASATAMAAKATADGVNDKATQALSGATTAKTLAESADAKASALSGRLTAAETEINNVGGALAVHTGDGNIHTPKAGIESIAKAAADALKDGGDGSTLPADRATLQALSALIDGQDAVLNGFLNGTEPGQRIAILAELERLNDSMGDWLTRADVVNALDSEASDVPLAAAQGSVIAGKIDVLRAQVVASGKPWVKVVTTVPATWPESLQWDGLLLCFSMTDGAVSNPKWYVNNRNVPAQLMLDATGIRLLDGTTVQTGVASSLAASVAAQTAAEKAGIEAASAKNEAATAKSTAEAVDAKASQAQSDATSAKTDAAEARTVAEGVDAKASQAQSDATAAKADAASAKSTADAVDAKASQAKIDAVEAKTTANTVDAKATQAESDAAEAKVLAMEAIAKTPALAKQTIPGVVMGSDTIIVGEDGSLHSVGSEDGTVGIFVGQWVFLRQTSLPVGYIALDGSLYTDANTRFPTLLAYLAAHPDEVTTDADWQARQAAASGTGGVPYYVYDQTADTLQMPDTRGDTPYHGTAGTWEGDAIRNVKGEVGRPFTYNTSYPNGPFYITRGGGHAGGTGYAISEVGIDLSLVVPTATTNHPRRLGMTLAVYAGIIGA